MDKKPFAILDTHDPAQISIMEKQLEEKMKASLKSKKSSAPYKGDHNDNSDKSITA